MKCEKCQISKIHRIGVVRKNENIFRSWNKFDNYLHFFLVFSKQNLKKKIWKILEIFVKTILLEKNNKNMDYCLESVSKLSTSHKFFPQID